MGDSRVLHLCVENDALVTNGLITFELSKPLISFNIQYLYASKLKSICYLSIIITYVKVVKHINYLLTKVL